MCDFASFLITDKGKILVYDILSHSKTAKHFKLKPGTYREAKWLNNNPESLTITTRGTDNTIFKKARKSILSMYPTRQDFLDKYFTGEVQLRMVKNDDWIIQFINDPTKKIQLKSVNGNKYILEVINKNNT